jgi:hypothetical protein
MRRLLTGLILHIKRLAVLSVWFGPMVLVWIWMALVASNHPTGLGSGLSIEAHYAGLLSKWCFLCVLVMIHTIIVSKWAIPRLITISNTLCVLRRASVVVLALAAGSAQAATWYVRPLTTFENAVENGQTYATAWDGFGAIVYGEGGVQAGDTLYICGIHQYGASGADWTAAQRIQWGVDGTTEAPITIRGDYPGDPGIIISATRSAPSASWSEHPSYPGVWVITSTASIATQFENDPASATPVMTYVASTTATVTTRDASIRATGSEIWWNPNGTGYTAYTQLPVRYHTWNLPPIELKGRDFITVRNLTLLGCTSNYGNVTINKGDGPSSGVQVLDCTIRFAQYTGIYAAASDTTDVLIEGNTISETPTGTYTIGNGGGAPVRFRRWTFRGNTVRSGDSAAFLIGTAADRHALGGQDISDSIFENNLVQDWAGDGLLNYVNSPALGSSNIFRNNLIFNLADPNGAFHHYGIAITGSNAADWSTRTLGNQIYNNIVWGCTPGVAGAAAGDGAAIRLKGKWFGDHRPVIYNNVLGDSVTGLFDFTMTGYTGSGFVAKNNIFTSNTTHVWLDSGDTVEIDSDYNLFYPDGAGRFYYKDSSQANFAAWQTTSGGDAASVLADPLLTGDGYDAAADFQPLAGSPAIGAGVVIEGIDGLLTDYAGTTRGAAWDIGAYEFLNSGGGVPVGFPGYQFSAPISPF